MIGNKEMSESEPLMRRRKIIGSIKTNVLQLYWDKFTSKPSSCVNGARR